MLGSNFSIRFFLGETLVTRQTDHQCPNQVIFSGGGKMILVVVPNQ